MNGLAGWMRVRDQRLQRGEVLPDVARGLIEEMAGRGISGDRAVEG